MPPGAAAARLRLAPRCKQALPASTGSNLTMGTLERDGRGWKHVLHFEKPDSNKRHWDCRHGFGELNHVTNV